MWPVPSLATSIFRSSSVIIPFHALPFLRRPYPAFAFCLHRHCLHLPDLTFRPHRRGSLDIVSAPPQPSQLPLTSPPASHHPLRPVSSCIVSIPFSYSFTAPSPRPWMPFLCLSLLFALLTRPHQTISLDQNTRRSSSGGPHPTNSVPGGHFCRPMMGTSSPFKQFFVGCNPSLTPTGVDATITEVRRQNLPVSCLV